MLINYIHQQQPFKTVIQTGKGRLNLLALNRRKHNNNFQPNLAGHFKFLIYGFASCNKNIMYATKIYVFNFNLEPIQNYF